MNRSVGPEVTIVSERHITQIPLPGGSGERPTGAIQFMNDWPGLFLRGDEAMGLLVQLRLVEQLLREKCGTSLPGGLRRLAEIIERDVIVRE
jgi:hypothetical protein